MGRASKRTQGAAAAAMTASAAAAAAKARQPYSMTRARTPRNVVLLSTAAVLFVVGVVYLRSAGFGFVSWDDDVHVYDNSSAEIPYRLVLSIHENRTGCVADPLPDWLKPIIPR